MPATPFVVRPIILALVLAAAPGAGPWPCRARDIPSPEDLQALREPGSLFQRVADRMGDRWKGDTWTDLPATPYPAHPKAGDRWTVYGGVELAYVPAGRAVVDGRRIRIRRGFWLGVTEVGPVVWRNLMRDDPSSPDRASFDDARRFCMRLSMRAHGNASAFPRDVRPPTRDELAYALRPDAGCGLTHLPGLGSEWTGDRDARSPLLRPVKDGADGGDGVGFRVFFRAY